MNQSQKVMQVSIKRSDKHMSCVMRKKDFSYAKTKMQISCVGIEQLISAFVFTCIVQYLILLHSKFQASSMTVQGDFCQAWPEAPKTAFLTLWLKLSACYCSISIPVNVMIEQAHTGYF